MKLCNIALAVSLCVPLISTSHAQKMPKARQERLMGMAKQLHVTHKQAKQLLPILQAQEPQLQAIRNDQSLSRTEKIQRLQAVHEQSDPQIKAILTPAQFTQLQAYRQQRRDVLMAAAKAQMQSQGGASRSK
jgi:Spy/CpxP family protein refolding chaperone